LLQRTFQIVNLLLQLGLGLGQSVDFVFFCLQVIQGLLMGLLEGLLLLGQLRKTFILRGHLLCQVLHLVFSGMFLLLHFGQGQLQVIDVLLELRAFVLQLPLLGGQFSVDLLLILQSLSGLFELCLQLDLTFNKTLASLLSIIQSLVS